MGDISSIEDIEIGLDNKDNDNYNIDNLFEIPPNLVSKSVDLL